MPPAGQTKKGIVVKLFLSQIISGLNEYSPKYYFNVLIVGLSPEISKPIFIELYALLTTRKLFSQTVLDSDFVCLLIKSGGSPNLSGRRLYIHLFILATGRNSI